MSNGYPEELIVWSVLPLNILLLSSGVYLLVHVYLEAKDCQTIYLINMAAIEILWNLLRLGTGILRHFRFDTSILPVLIFDYFLVLVYHAAMFLFTSDRLFQTLSPLKYRVDWTTTKTKVSIGISWLVSIYIALCIALPASRPYTFNDQFNITIIPIFLLFTIVVYITIIVVFFIARQRTNTANPLFTRTIFRKSHCYFDLILVATYIVLTFVPCTLLYINHHYHMFGQRKFLFYFWICNILSTTIDSLLYIFLEKKVRNTLIQKFYHCWQRLSNTFNINTNDILGKNEGNEIEMRLLNTIDEDINPNSTAGISISNDTTPLTTTDITTTTLSIFQSTVNDTMTTKTSGVAIPLLTTINASNCNLSSTSVVDTMPTDRNYCMNYAAINTQSTSSSTINTSTLNNDNFTAALITASTFKSINNIKNTIQTDLKSNNHNKEVIEVQINTTRAKNTTSTLENNFTIAKEKICKAHEENTNTFATIYEQRKTSTSINSSTITNPNISKTIENKTKTPATINDQRKATMSINGITITKPKIPKENRKNANDSRTINNQGKPFTSMNAITITKPEISKANKNVSKTNATINVQRKTTMSINSITITKPKIPKENRKYTNDSITINNQGKPFTSMNAITITKPEIPKANKNVSKTNATINVQRKTTMSINGVTSVKHKKAKENRNDINNSATISDQKKTSTPMNSITSFKPKTPNANSNDTNTPSNINDNRKAAMSINGITITKPNISKENRNDRNNSATINDQKTITSTSGITIILPPENVDDSQNSRIIEFPEELLANASKEDLNWLPRGDSPSMENIVESDHKAEVYEILKASDEFLITKKVPDLSREKRLMLEGCKKNKSSITGTFSYGAKQVKNNAALNNDDHRTNLPVLQQNLKPSGLPNIGNSCYLNSILQFFRVVPWDWKSIIDFSIKGKFHEIMLKLDLGDMITKEMLREFQCLLSIAMNDNEENQQQDVHEAIIKILEECIGLKMYIEYAEKVDTFCINCKRSLIVNDTHPFLVLHPTLQGMSLQSCIEHYQRPETLDDYRCDACSLIGDGNLLYTKTITSQPPVILIQLGQLGANGSYSVIPDKLIEINSSVYSFYASIFYDGYFSSGRSMGHYLTFAQIDHVWYKFNDSQVHSISYQDVINASSKFYILCYRRQDICD